MLRTRESEEIKSFAVKVRRSTSPVFRVTIKTEEKKRV